MHDERVEQLKRESLPQLLRELSLQTTTLVRQEIELATTELREKAKAAAAGASLIGAAAVLALAAFGAEEIGLRLGLSDAQRRQLRIAIAQRMGKRSQREPRLRERRDLGPQ